jgi:hypothetical protein
MRSAVVPWHHMTLIMWWKGLLISHKSTMECHIVIVGRGSVQKSWVYVPAMCSFHRRARPSRAISRHRRAPNRPLRLDWRRLAHIPVIHTEPHAFWIKRRRRDPLAFVLVCTCLIGCEVCTRRRLLDADEARRDGQHGHAPADRRGHWSVRSAPASTAKPLSVSTASCSHVLVQ